MAQSDSERDDFWDIDKLVPKKKKIISPFVTETKTVLHTAEGTCSSAEQRKLNFDAFKGVSESTEEVYENEGSGLIRKVTVKRFVDKYDFYGAFRKAALLYYDYRTDRCDFAPFYSYMPQYSQLGTEQKGYYFYWRDCVRRGKFIRSDYSYLYLYVYEILNLPDKIVPEEGLQLLCRLWGEYRASLPRIDSYFALWIQDYCLVHRLPCPTALIRPFISEAIAASEFKEFYLSDIDKTGNDGTDAMLAYLSDYDFRRGRYAGGEYAELYRTHMLNAMWRLLYRLDLTAVKGGASLAVLRRDAFAHSLCTHAVKCKLEITYVKLSENDNIRAIVTSGVRYTENKLRALFGIKSRLAVKDLPDEYKHIIDLYFAALLKAEEKRRAAESIPEYEKLYDSPSEELSFDGADEIERASWLTTRRLVSEQETVEAVQTDEGTIYEASAEDTDDGGSDLISDESVMPSAESETVEDYGLSREDISALLALLKYGKTVEDSTAERINEAFADGFGDIILEHDGECCKIIEDYEEEIEQWLLRIMK